MSDRDQMKKFRIHIITESWRKEFGDMAQWLGVSTALLKENQSSTSFRIPVCDG